MTLQSKLDQLRELRESKAPIVPIVPKTKFPLNALLRLYSVAPRSLAYVNDYEGFKLLISWLSPLEILTPTPEFITYYKDTHTWLRNWDTQQLAKVLNIPESTLIFNATKGYQWRT